MNKVSVPKPSGKIVEGVGKNQRYYLYSSDAKEWFLEQAPVFGQVSKAPDNRYYSLFVDPAFDAAEVRKYLTEGYEG